MFSLLRILVEGQPAIDKVLTLTGKTTAVSEIEMPIEDRLVPVLVFPVWRKQKERDQAELLTFIGVSLPLFARTGCCGVRRFASSTMFCMMVLSITERSCEC